MTDGCPHLALVLKVNKEDLLQKSEGCCSICNRRGKLWSCLQHGCQFIGCSESDFDHSTKHYQELKHSIAVNLVSFRIWCFACNIEVHLPSAFTPHEMKSLKRKRKLQASEQHKNGNSSPAKPKSKNQPEIEEDSEMASFSANMDEESQEDGIPRGLTGLRNLGNTCYMNSALQAISNCLPLTHHFLNPESVYSIDKKPSMAKNYHKLINDIWNPIRHPCINPTGIHLTLKAINPAFRGYHQQDAQEFLRCLMDRLHEEMKYPILSPDWNEQPKSTASHHPNQVEEMQLDTQSGSEFDSPSQHISTSHVHQGRSKSPSSSLESFHSITSEPDRQATSSQPRVPGVSAGTTTNHMQTSYDNLSKLHGQEVGDDVPQVERLQSPWPQMNDTQFKRSPSPTRIEDNTEVHNKQQVKKHKYKFQSIISEIFDGELRSSVQCLTCDQVSHTRENFQDLSLPIPGKDDMAILHGTTGYYPASGSTLLPVVPGFKGPCSESRPSYYIWNSVWGVLEWFKSWFWGPQVTLRDCLSAFFSADELKGDNMYSCEKCKKLRNGVKYCRLLQLPEVLCVHLKRFRHEYLTSYSSKISIPVSFPITGLDLRRFLAQDSPSNCTSYDLCSVIVHLGNAGGGHYTTYAKNFTNNRWYEFDDQYVTQVSEFVVANAEAYVLFYCKSSVEAVRARDRITNLFQEEQQKKVSVMREPTPRSLLQFYVSIKWINKFLTFVEPGPIDNSDFVCPHLDIRPECFDNLEQYAILVSKRIWQELHARFEGGPTMTHPTLCKTCTEEYITLQERVEYEREKFLQLNRSGRDAESASNCVYISLEWFREWEDFLNGKLPEPPGEIENQLISFTKEGNHFLKKNSSHAPITMKAWEFLISIYGGGPLVTIRTRQTSTTAMGKSGSGRPMKTSPEKKFSPSNKSEIKTEVTSPRTAEPEVQLHAEDKDKETTQKASPDDVD